MTSLDPDVSMPDELMAAFTQEVELAEHESGEQPRTEAGQTTEPGAGEDRVVGPVRFASRPN